MVGGVVVSNKVVWWYQIRWCGGIKQGPVARGRDISQTPLGLSQPSLVYHTSKGERVISPIEGSKG
jgi:hypothetical protein